MAQVWCGLVHQSKLAECTSSIFCHLDLQTVENLGEQDSPIAHNGTEGEGIAKREAPCKTLWFAPSLAMPLSSSLLSATGNQMSTGWHGERNGRDHPGVGWDLAEA